MNKINCSVVLQTIYMYSVGIKYTKQKCKQRSNSKSPYYKIYVELLGSKLQLIRLKMSLGNMSESIYESTQNLIILFLYHYHEAFHFYLRNTKIKKNVVAIHHIILT